MFVSVIFGIACGEFTAPVNRKAHRLKLRAHDVNIFMGPFARMLTALNRCVFSRKSKGIPAHRVHDIIALRPFIARDHIAQRIIADMAYVDATRGIREHFKDVIFFAFVVFGDFERFAFRPFFLPFGFGLPDIIALCHLCLS